MWPSSWKRPSLASTTVCRGRSGADGSKPSFTRSGCASRDALRELRTGRSCPRRANHRERAASSAPALIPIPRASPARAPSPRIHARSDSTGVKRHRLDSDTDPHERRCLAGAGKRSVVMTAAPTERPPARSNANPERTRGRLGTNAAACARRPGTAVRAGASASSRARLPRPSAPPPSAGGAGADRARAAPRTAPLGSSPRTPRRARSGARGAPAGRRAAGGERAWAARGFNRRHSRRRSARATGGAALLARRAADRGPERPAQGARGGPTRPDR